MTDERTAVQALQDRQEITDLINLYANCADADDFDRLLTVFAPDARLESANGVLNGMEEIGAAMSPEGRRKARAASSGLQFEKSTHLMSNIAITLARDTAHAESSAVAFLVGPKDGRQVLVARGIKYVDDFVRLETGWKIGKRVHSAIWQFGPVPLAN